MEQQVFLWSTRQIFLQKLANLPVRCGDYIFHVSFRDYFVRRPAYRHSDTEWSSLLLHSLRPIDDDLLGRETKICQDCDQWGDNFASMIK